MVQDDFINRTQIIQITLKYSQHVKFQQTSKKCFKYFKSEIDDNAKVYISKKR
jgi:hypothetical protein